MGHAIEPKTDREILLEAEILRLHSLLAECDSELEYLGADVGNTTRIAISQATGVFKPKGEKNG